MLYPRLSANKDAMIKKLFILLLSAAALVIPAVAAEPVVEVMIVHSRDRYPAGGEYPVLIEIRVADSWYIHGPAGEEGGDGLIPTELILEETEGVRVGDLRYPEPEPVKLDYTPGSVPLFSGSVRVHAAMAVSEDARPGRRVINGTLSYQACKADSCLPPETADLEIALRVAPAGAGAKTLNRELFEAQARPDEPPRASLGRWSADGGLWLALAGLFLGGLALNLTPCIYPLIPITISFFGGRSGRSRGPRALHGAIYMVGLATTNSLLGVGAALSGGLLGAALQNPFILLAVAAVLVILALSFFGFWELRIPGFLGSLGARHFGGYSGTLFMGLTLGVVAAPCLGPFVLGLLAFVGQKGDPVLGFAYFFVLSLGMGLPLAVLAMFSGAVDRLPGSGDWMVWVRKFMGWVLVGMAAYISVPILPGGWSGALLGGSVAAAAGLHLGWLERSGKASVRFRRARKAVGLVLIAAGAVYASQGGDREGMQWIPYRPGVLAEAVRKERPVILDFSAEWCLPCRELEEKVFSDPEVVRAGRDFVTVRVDLTRKKPEHDALLERYRVRGVPTVIFIRPDGTENRSLRVQSYLGKDEFLERMRRLAPTT